MVKGVSDSAANIKAAMRMLGSSFGLNCFAHKLNSCFDTAFQQTPRVVALEEKLMKTVTITKRSSKAKRYFAECQKLAGASTSYVLLKYCKTRWNSLKTCFARWLQIPRKAFKLFYLEFHNPKLYKCEPLNEDDWKLLEDMNNLLSNLYEATTELSGQKFTTLSRVIPTVMGLIEAYSNPDEGLGRTATIFSQKIASELIRRFDLENIDKAYTIAMVLDPCYKDVCHDDDPYKKSESHTLVKDEVMEEVSKDQPVVVEESIEMIDNQAKKAPPTNFKKGFFEKKAKREKKLSLIKNQREKLEIELRNYLEEGPLEEETDPIVWWIDIGKEQFPLLFETAMKYLCIPATR